jgi:hypothetical protein
MSYRAILTVNAEEDIRRMPAAVARYVLRQLVNLENDPILLSGKSHFPFREKCQLFSFDFDWNNQRYFINVHFQYGADEETLIISDAPWQAATDWWEEGDEDDFET